MTFIALRSFLGTFAGASAIKTLSSQLNKPEVSAQSIALASVT